MPPRVSSPEFVGRTAELGRLEAALARAEQGAAGAAFVAGESGVGKTRLLRELERRAVDRGVRVLRGDCVAFGAGEMAYAPLAAALRRLARELDPAALDELLGGARDELARLAPELSPTLPGTAPAQDMTAASEAHAQARLFGLLRALLDGLAAEAPVLLAVEDLHWADRSTLEFLSSLLGGLRDERLLLVCTYRSDELHRRHPLRPFLAEEERRELVERIELEPFSPAELAAQVAGILGGAAEPELVARLHARCEGNAFFAEELLAASDAAEGPLPASLRDVLSLRLEALPQDTLAVLRVAAAAGRRAGHRLLATVTDLPEPALLEALRTAVAHHVLVHDSDGCAFRHALLQEAAYEDLLPGERTALHLALAEALSDDPALPPGRRPRSWRTIGARRTACPRRSAPTSAPVWRPSGSPRSPRPGSTSSGRSRSGTSSRTPTSALSSATRRSWPTPRRMCTSPATTTARSRWDARRSSSPIAAATSSPRRSHASAWAGICGSRATAMGPWPRTATRCASSRPSRRPQSWRGCSQAKRGS